MKFPKNIKTIHTAIIFSLFLLSTSVYGQTSDNKLLIDKNSSNKADNQEFITTMKFDEIVVSNLRNTKQKVVKKVMYVFLDLSNKQVVILNDSNKETIIYNVKKMKITKDTIDLVTTYDGNQVCVMVININNCDKQKTTKNFDMTLSEVNGKQITFKSNTSNPIL